MAGFMTNFTAADMPGRPKKTVAKKPVAKKPEVKPVVETAKPEVSRSATGSKTELVIE
jgi:hypothetical protein